MAKFLTHLTFQNFDKTTFWILFKFMNPILIIYSVLGKVHPCTVTEALYRPYGP